MNAIKEKELFFKYLAPIMIQNDNDMYFIYSHHLEELLSTIDEQTKKEIIKIINDKKIPVIKPEYSIEKEQLIAQIYTENRFEDGMNITLGNLARYLKSDLKKEVNLGLSLESTNIFNHLKINTDQEKILVALDTIINCASYLLKERKEEFQKDEIINSRVLGIKLKNISRYYNSSLFGKNKPDKATEEEINMVNAIESIIANATSFEEIDSKRYLKRLSKQNKKN